MEGKSVLQSSERTERSHRRRLSSILKASHSPLNDAGSGNEQEPTIEKRQKGSRRVSFAETIRVFTPELQPTGSDDKENEGYGNSNPSSNTYKGAADRSGIAGMDTLLHGQIQAAGHNSDWNSAECGKDRTIFFSSDNDMDMTASNTVTIHGLTEEGTKKIDTKQFLASLKSQTSKDVAKIQEFPLSTGGEKHIDFKGESSMENKIKFSDFLASLGGEKSKATGTCDDDKTVLFTLDQQDMEMTRSHTVLIDRKVLSDISKTPKANIVKEQFYTFNKEIGNYPENNTHISGESQDKTLLYDQNDMDMTRSHTTAIEGKILEGLKAKNVTMEFRDTKRKSILDRTTNAVTSGICFQGEDMDITKSSIGFYLAEEASRAPCSTLPNNTLLFRPDQDDMDMTYSHTIAISHTDLHGNSQVTRSVPCVPSTLKSSVADRTVFGDEMELTKSHTMIIDELNQLAIHNRSVTLQNIAPTTCAELQMGREVDMVHNVSRQRLHNETVHQEGEMEMTNVNVGLLLTAGKSRPWNKTNPVLESFQEKTMYLCDEDDMNMTRAHTIAIENKVIAEVGNRSSQSNGTFSAASESMSNLRDVKYTSKPPSMLDINERRYTNRTLCDQDIDITVSNTGVIDNQKPGRDVQLPGLKSKMTSSVSNQSETRDGDLFNKQGGDHLENSPVSDESQDKTLFLCEQNDMDITRSHTTAIESKILDGIKAKNVTMEFQNTKRESILHISTIADVRSGKSFQEDMDVTKSNTVFIDHVLDKSHNKGVYISDVLSRRKSESSRPMALVPNDKVFPFSNMKNDAETLVKSSDDSTICNEDDMEMTRSHKGVIESKRWDGAKAKNAPAEFLDTRKSVLGLTTNDVDVADDLTSAISFQGEDMDITKSNTVFIDQISDILHDKNTHVFDGSSKRKSVSFHPKALVTSNETILPVSSKKQTDANTHIVNRSSVDKTICYEEDMEMTRPHKVGIESKIWHGAQAKNVPAEFLNTTRKSVLGLTTNAAGMADDLTSAISVQGEDMDITKSNTVFIDQVSDKLHDKSARVSDASSKRKSVSSRPKSLGFSDEITIPVYSTKPTKAISHFSEGLANKSSLERTIFNEDDMEMTKSHTLAIESKILDCVKTKNDPRRSFFDRMTNVVDMAGDLTSGMSFKAGDIDITKSNTVFIDQISDEPHNKSAHSSEVHSKSKSVSSRPKSLGFSDEKMLLACNMKKTDVDPQISEEVVNKSSVDITIFQDDMERRKSHTMAIESKILNDAKAKSVPAEFLDARRKSVLDRTNAFDMAGDVTAGMSFQGEDMDTTKSNTVFIDQISDEPHNKGVHTSNVLSRRKSLSSRPKSLVPSDETLPVYSTKPTKAISHFSEGLVNKSSVDRTIFNEDDMEMTKSHTLAIESKILDCVKTKNDNRSVLDRTTKAVDIADNLTSGISFKGEDMDITKSNTVFIDQISDGPPSKSAHSSYVLSKRKSVSCSKSFASSDDTIHIVCNMEETNVNFTDTLVTKSSADRTVCHQGDMEMTRSHTVAIESKLLDGAKSKNITEELQNTKRKPVLDRTAVDMADDLTSAIAFQNEDMDMTKSNIVYIDQTSDIQHNKSGGVSLGLSKRKSVSSHPKSLVPGDETILHVCNMEETDAYVHFTERLEYKASVDKTLCNEGDMDITRSHTVAIENKTFEEVDIAYPVKTNSRRSTCDDLATARPQAASLGERVPPLVAKDLSMPLERNDATSTMNFSMFPRNSVLEQRNTILVCDGDETKFPSDQSMEITGQYTDTVEVNFLDQNSHIPSSSTGVTKSDGVNVCGELMEIEQSDNLSKPTEKLECCRRKSFASSLTLSVRSGIFLEGLGNEELSQVHTSPVEDVSLLKPGSCNAETDILDKSNNTTAGFDHQSKENRHTSIRNVISANADSKLIPNSGNGVDYKIESVAEVGVSDDASKSVYEDEVKGEVMSAKIESLHTTRELRPVIDSLIDDPNRVTSDSRNNFAPRDPKDCDTYQKDPEVTLEMELRKSRFKGKRVSFYFPEVETAAKNEMLEQLTMSACLPEKEMVAKDLMSEQVITTEKHGGEHQARTVRATEEINQASVVSQMPVTENLGDKTLPKEPDLSNINVVPEGISSDLGGLGISAKLSKEGTKKRRSVADVLLSIQNLTQKPKLSPHHTAPVSSLIAQLPVTTQTLCPSRSVTEQIWISSELPNKETIQEKEPTEKTNTISREYHLPSRRSVKMFLPKLPNKRASSTSNLLERAVSSVSEAQPQNDQSSKVLPKTFRNIDDGQCIDEEMLPDDQEINSMFDYEVPEGAWEDLCENEALQQNLTVSTYQPKDSIAGQKRIRNIEPDSESQREKRGRLNDDGQTSAAFKASDKSSSSDYTAPQASKAIEQTYNSSSSQDSRADGMSVELSSQQCSQMDSQLPWDSRCEQSLWQSFQDGGITVQEFFLLLGIRILIQKPRYSERPSKRGVTEELTVPEILLDQYVYQPKLQVYDEECHALFQAIEELKASTELQHKPLLQVNSLLWEALRMCSENELMCFGATLKNMKSLYSKKSKLLAHKAKVSTYSKLLHAAQVQKEQLQARLEEADRLLGELEDAISRLHTDPVTLAGVCRSGDQTAEAELDGLQSQQQRSIRENVELEERKDKLSARLCSLQEESRVLGVRLQEPSFTEWELVKWTDNEAAFHFLYDSLELSISFGDYIDGEIFNNQPCRRISGVSAASQLDEESAPPSTLLVHRLIAQYCEKKSAFCEAYKTQNDLPQLLFNLSLVVSRCKLLGEELENLTKWGAMYNVLKVIVRSQEVSLLFSSSATLVKFELTIHLSDAYPTAPLSFTLNNRIGSITQNKVSEIMSKVPIGLWYLKRTVKSLHENLLV
ncbi:outer kinetochore KNL1 complex subunit KNL1 isoform 1-T2 [Anomaloglossus baeobatrachus]|uniref:outer kinetochore KNL1 complex subunit KNL1 n=1 Tax=Anomaloglossus baeobatrachus TaxID=238106 RepID=UPI003F4FEFCC